MNDKGSFCSPLFICCSNFMKNINTEQIMGSTNVDKQGCQEVLLTYQIINQLQYEKATCQYYFKQS